MNLMERMDFLNMLATGLLAKFTCMALPTARHLAGNEAFLRTQKEFLTKPELSQRHRESVITSYARELVQDNVRLCVIVTIC